jgi:fibro-slime domain-containing protein
MKRPVYWLSSVAALVVFASACGDGDGDSKFRNGNGGNGGNGGSGGGIIIPGAGGVLGDGGPQGGSGGGFPIGPDGIPIGFTKADIGAWKLGARITSGGSAGSGSGGSAGSGTGCGSVLTGLVRDFKRGDRAGGHPDFQTFEGDGLEGIVEQDLPADRKPKYFGTEPHIDEADDNQQHTTTPANFRQWYVSDDDVNQTFLLHLFLERQSDGKYTFESNAFFPLDGAGFGDEGLDNGETPPVLHNYLFTTEVHTEFRYKGGETFRFEGDDDLWVFINRKLAIDLGGMHSSLDRTIDLDDAAGRLGITTGNVYPLELFHAERRRVHSNFRIDTNLEFVNCGTVVPEPPE